MDWHARVDPELRSLVAKLPDLTFSLRKARLMRVAQRWLAPTVGVSRTVEHQVVEVGSWFLPREGPQPEAAVLWIHGGGRIVGEARQDAPTCSRLVDGLGVGVLSVEYRLAPDHPFPAPLDDCHAGWRWLREQGFSRIVIGGESAGGGLAAELCQRLRDEGDLQPVGQALVYPMLDDRTALDTALTALGHLVWNNTSNHVAWQAYLGEHFGAERAPAYAAASRCEDLSGLPPAWLTVGEHDLFFREVVDYTDRLRAAGVPAQLHEVAGGVHGIFTIGRHEPPIERLWAELLSFVGARVSGA